MTDRVWLVRHASTEWTGRRWLGRRDLPLTAAGVAEAQALAGRLAPALPAGVAVVSSPALRARETAAPLAAAVGVEVETDPDLREIDVGRAEGLTWEEVRRDLPELALAVEAGGRIEWPGGERGDTLRVRLAAAWERIDGRGAPVVVVTHAGVVAGLLAELVPGAEPGWLGPASFVALGRDGSAWTIVEEEAR